MGTLAIDIETASPFDEPGREDSDTRYFEWLSIAMAYRESARAEPETTVLFRRGGWQSEHTAALFERVFEWCAGREIDRTLTYNGASFDLKHLHNWAVELAQSGEGEQFVSRLHDSLPGHVDLAKAATDRHEDELRDGQPVLPDFVAYECAGIDNDRIFYGDYDFHADYLEDLDEPFVTGSHVGRVLGERFVEGVVAGLDGTKMHEELRRLLIDYSLSDVVDLFALYESLGGSELDTDYHYPIENVER